MGGFGTEPSAQDAVPGSGSENVMTCQSLNRGIFFGNWCGILSFPHSSVGKDSTCHAGDPGSIPILRRSTGEGIGYSLQYSWAFLVSQLVKNPLAMWETWV